MRWSGTAAVPVCQMTLIISGPFYRYTFQKRLRSVTRIASAENSSNQSLERNPMKTLTTHVGGKIGTKLDFSIFPFTLVSFWGGIQGTPRQQQGDEGKLKPSSTCAAAVRWYWRDIHTWWLLQSIPCAPPNEFIFRTNFKGLGWCITE